jgi:hypothetical protein
MSVYLCPANYLETFIQLDALLCDFQAVWRARPFIDDNMGWQQQLPELNQALLALSDDKFTAFDDEAVLLQWLADFLPELCFVNQLSIAPFDGELIDMAKFADVGIPGRKKQQIIGFTSVVNQFVGRSPDLKGGILDWCSGKGHLAKHLHSVLGQNVTCLEYDKVLCDAGEREVEKLKFGIQFIEQDVLEPISSAVTHAASLNTALHACGDLHVSMMNCAVKASSAHIALSPCCYHLTKQTHYKKLSATAKQSTLVLDKNDLRLAVLQTVTAGTRVRRLREQELVWRIGFDLWQRLATGEDQYRSMPSINKQWLSGSFVDYCAFMAKAEQLPLVENVDSEVLLIQARCKHKQIIRLEKVRLAFRKAMEYWLLLDRVLYLEEQGYKVEIRLFCDEKTTPRNALILARR